MSSQNTLKMNTAHTAFQHFIEDQKQATGHMSHVTCHMSHVTIKNTQVRAFNHFYCILDTQIKTLEYLLSQKKYTRSTPVYGLVWQNTKRYAA
jgi:hypothetical protein